ncbi:MAG: YtxH domain-containing protein [Candidatus Peregrinibacteria bacterium]
MKLGRILIGLVSGITFGMLFAPKKGKDLRNEILKKSNKSGTDALKALGNAMMDAGAEAYAEFLKLSENEQVQALKDLSREKLDQFVKTAEDHGYEIAGKVKATLEGAGKALTEKAAKIQKEGKKTTGTTKKQKTK